MLQSIQSSLQLKSDLDLTINRAYRIYRITANYGHSSLYMHLLSLWWWGRTEVSTKNQKFDVSSNAKVRLSNYGIVVDDAFMDCYRIFLFYKGVESAAVWTIANVQ